VFVWWFTTIYSVHKWSWNWIKNNRNWPTDPNFLGPCLPNTHQIFGLLSSYWWTSSHLMKVRQHYVVCSSTTRAAVMEWTRTRFSRRAFSVAGSDIWNSLPPEIRLTENFATFKKKLKTHLLDIAFLTTVTAQVYSRQECLYFTQHTTASKCCCGVTLFSRWQSIFIILAFIGFI